MKKCIHCGQKLRDQAVICVKCGYLQREEPQAPMRLKAAEPAPADRAQDPAAQEFPEISVASSSLKGFGAPVGKLKTNRGLLKFLLLSVITFGIYGIVVMSSVSTDINVMASRYDGKKTMHYCLILFIFSWLTLGIAPMVWNNNLCVRIGMELNRRRISYRFGAGTYWGWGFFGSLILVGPLIYTYKLLKAMNLLAAHYNVNG